MITKPEFPKTYEEFCEEEEAIHSGSAMELAHCYLCEPDTNKRVVDQEAGPIRGIARRSVTRGPDPYEARHMVPCGHVLI